MKVTNNYFDTLANRRIITVQTESGRLQLITADFDNESADFSAMSEEQLIKKAQEWFYRTYLQGKFLNEAVELTEAKAKEMEELAKKMNKVFTDAKSQLAKMKETDELAQGSIVEALEMLFDHEARITDLEGTSDEDAQMDELGHSDDFNSVSNDSPNPEPSDPMEGGE